MEADQLIDVLGRSKGESTKAFAALVDYAKQGGGREGGAKGARSIRDLQRTYQNMAREGFQVPTKKLSRLFSWSVKWEWQRRVNAWDQALIEAEAAAWIMRRQALRDQQWEDGERLRKLGRNWLGKLEYIDEKGITAGQAARLLEAASELQTAAVGKSDALAAPASRLSEADESMLEEMYAKYKSGGASALEQGEEGDGESLHPGGSA